MSSPDSTRSMRVRLRLTENKRVVNREVECLQWRRKWRKLRRKTLLQDKARTFPPRFNYRDLKTLNMPTLLSSTHPFSSISMNGQHCIPDQHFTLFLLWIFPVYSLLPTGLQGIWIHSGIFSWAVDKMIEMTRMLPDVAMHKSSLVCSQLQWFSIEISPHHWSVNGHFAISSWGGLSNHTHYSIIQKKSKQTDSSSCK